MKNLEIREELQNLLPRLSESEYAGLEADIIAKGCISPIVTWNNVIVDGHHRYRICQAHGISFDTVSLEFQSLEEALFWAWTHQENRRNITPYQRAQIALRFKPMLEAKGKVNMVAGGGDRKSEQAKTGLTNLSDPIPEVNTRAELAKMAKVSEGNIVKVEFLEAHADDATKEKLLKGETTINKEYNRYKKQQPDPKPAKRKKVNAPPVVKEADEKPEVKLGLYLKPGEKSCAETCEPYVPRTTLTNIPQDKPDVLLANLEAHFREGFIEDLVLSALEYLRTEKGKKITDAMMRDLTKRLKNQQ